MDVKVGWANARDVRTAEIEVRTNLGLRERTWIVSRLMSQSGIEDVSFSDTHGFRIEYDAHLVTGAEIVNSLYRCGLQAPERRSRARPDSGCPAKP
jgi:hypothetical protein